MITVGRTFPSLFLPFVVGKESVYRSLERERKLYIDTSVSRIL